MLHAPRRRLGRAAATIALAVAMASSSSVLALAQPEDPAYQRQVQEYQNKQEQYRAQQQDYNRQRDAYTRQRQGYRERRETYDAQRADYEAARAAYDARYGAGAFDNYARDHRTGAGPYGADGPPQSRLTVVETPYRDSPCEQRRDNRAAAGGVIGALAGAAIGSNLASGGRTGGAVLGAVAGGVVGANLGRNTAACDEAGYYFAEDQTYAYAEGEDAGRASGRQDREWYRRHNCRLAVAPATYADRTDYRYVRVCPDDRGRYRITD